MILNNTKLNKRNSGFTIVELLVVIVVIGILAAITIVSYTGVTARANKAKALSNAQSVVKVAESINADTSAKYPVTTGEFASLTSVARVPGGITIGVAAPTTANGTSTFQLYTLTTGPSTGGKIILWDYEKGARCNYAADNTTLVTTAVADTCLYYGAASAAANFGVTGLTIYAS